LKDLGVYDKGVGSSSVLGVGMAFLAQDVSHGRDPSTQ